VDWTSNIFSLVIQLLVQSSQQTCQVEPDLSTDLAEDEFDHHLGVRLRRGEVQLGLLPGIGFPAWAFHRLGAFQGRSVVEQHLHLAQTGGREYARFDPIREVEGNLTDSKSGTP